MAFNGDGVDILSYWPMQIAKKSGQFENSLFLIVCN